jgi:hypothetical protein
MLLRAMKVLVLVAGCVGVIGFFEPFFKSGYNDETVSAYRIAQGFDENALGLGNRPDIYESYGERGTIHFGSERGPGSSAAPVPFYFVSALVFLIAGFVSLVLGRFSGAAALCALAAAMLALGGWMREFRIDREIVRAGGTAMLAVGSKLLLLSGLLGLVGSLVVLIKREPAKPPPPPPPPKLPEARIVR